VTQLGPVPSAQWGRVALRHLLPAPLRRRGRQLVARGGLLWLHLRANPAWLAHRLGRTLEGSRRVVVVGSGHRVGSTWLFNLLRELGDLRNAIDEVPPHLHRYGALLPGSTDYHWLAAIRGWAILKGHADPPSNAAQAAQGQFVTIYRDPRDVLVSAAFQRARLPVAQGGWGEAFQALSVAQRIDRLLADPCPTLLDELERWYRTPFALRVSYEALHKRPAATLAGLVEPLALPVTQRQIEALVARHDFFRVTGRRPGEAAESATRKGIIGDWRNHFTPATCAHFRSAQGGRWGQILEEMGYGW